MINQNVFCISQIIIKNPILQEKLDIKRLYLSNIKKYARMGNWQDDVYIKEQIKIYSYILLGTEYPNETLSGQYFYGGYDLPVEYKLVLFYDLAAVTGFNINLIESGIMKNIKSNMIKDFNLNQKEEEIFNNVVKSSSDSELIEKIKEYPIMKDFIPFLLCIKSNISFLEKEPYKILVTANMSAGKSTFINTLAGKVICMAQNMACTSKIHSITGKVYDDGYTYKYDGYLLLNADKEHLLNNNDKNLSDNILIGTSFNGILNGQRLVIKDSPGVNFSLNSEHKKLSENMIKEKDYDLLVYIINASQLATDDEREHLTFVRKHIGEKPVLFIINKIDVFNECDESIYDIIERQITYLRENGFENPVVCPISAKAGLLAKISLSGKSTKQNNRELFCLEDKFDEMDLENFYNKYFPEVSIPDKSNEEEQLLKTCGITYVEEIINNYINEYRMKKSEKIQLQDKYKRAITITFIGNTGSGKSVLINSMLQRKLLPSENKAGTKTIIEISNEKVEGFCKTGNEYDAVIYNDKDKLLKKIENITYETFCNLNEDKDIYKIKINGKIPFINNSGIKATLVDTIGLNSKQKHFSKRQICDIMDNSMEGLVVYFLNTAQTSQEDDIVLDYISKKIIKEGQAAENRFLFVANKIDLLNSEDVAHFVLSLKRKLEHYGIRNAQIFPCSAYMSLCARTYFKDIDVRNMTRGQKESLTLLSMYAISYIDKFVSYKSLHLEDYTVLPKYAQEEINNKLRKGVNNGNLNEQALIHYGICSLEAAINDFIKSYI